MSAAPIEELITQAQATTELDIPLPPTDLPYDDGEPLETNRHRIAMNVLISSLEQAWADRNDFVVGGNMFIYFSTAQVRNQTAVATTGGTPATHCLDFRGPDFFAVLDVDGSYDRKSWIVWEEGGRYPDVIVELLSPSTAEVDLRTKKNLYERVFKTPDYFVFDPFNPTLLRGWCLNGNLRYQSLVPNDRGWLWSQSLQLWLGTWEGTVHRSPAVWLRFYDTQGQLVLLPEEAAQQQAEQAQQQAEQAQLQAEQAQLQAEQAQLQAEQAQLQAEQAQRGLAEAGQRTEELEAMLAKYRERFGEPIE